MVSEINEIALIFQQKFALTLNTIHSTNLNCKRLWYGVAADVEETDGEQYVIINLKGLEMELFECSSIQRKFKVKCKVKSIVIVLTILIII